MPMIARFAFAVVWIHLLVLPGAFAQHSSDVPDTALQTWPYGLRSKAWKKAGTIWQSKNYPAVLQFHTDTVVKGQILFRNDSLLGYWMDDRTLFNPMEADRFLRIYPEQSVKNITVYSHYRYQNRSSGLLWGPLIGAVHGTVLGLLTDEELVFPFIAISAGIGLVVGGIGEFIKGRVKNATVYKRPVDFELLSDSARKAYCLFPDRIPPAVLPVMTGGKPSDFPFDTLLAYSGQVQKAFRIHPFSIGLQIGTARPGYVSSVPVYGIHVWQKLPRRFLIGYQFRFTDNTYDYSNYTYLNVSLSEGVETNSKNHMLFVGYTPLPANRFRVHPFELTTGIGATYNLTGYQLSLFEQDEYVGYGFYSKEYQHTGVGISLLARADYYIVRNLSVNLYAERSFMRGFKTETKNATGPLSGITVPVESRTVRPSSFDIAVGIRVHY